jgi:hypothetical protein
LKLIEAWKNRKPLKTGGYFLFLLEPLKMKEGAAGDLKAGFTGIWAPLVLGRAELRLTILVKARTQARALLVIRYWAILF